MDFFVEYEGRQWNARHGGPFDRGSADSYYGRDFDPHCYVGRTGDILVDKENLTPDEIVEYTKGYEYNEMFGEKKDWG